MSLNFSSLTFTPFVGTDSPKEEVAISETRKVKTNGDTSSAKPSVAKPSVAAYMESAKKQSDHTQKKIQAIDVVDDAISTSPVYELIDMEKQKVRREVGHTIVSSSTTKKLSQLLDDYIDMETKLRQERRKHVATREEMKRLRALMQHEAEQDYVEVRLCAEPTSQDPSAFKESFQKSFQNSSSASAKTKSGKTVASVEETTANETETGDGDNSGNSHSNPSLKSLGRVLSYDSHDISLFLNDDRANDPPSPATTEHLGGSRQYWRDIILGVNDGLVSTFLLVAGVAGGGMSTSEISIIAIAGAVAGAVSMCAGEYIATKSQNEVIRGEVKLEQKHIQKYPKDELLEVPPLLELIGITKGNRDLQKRLLKHYAKDPAALLQLMLVLELGFLEDEQRSPFKAGFVSFFLFMFGSFPSVVPFLIPDIEPMTGLIAAAVATSCTLLMVGMVKTWASKGNCLTAALENLTVAGFGGAIAYGAGLLAESVLYGDS
jgi:vacuolar iron transporter family protein